MTTENDSKLGGLPTNKSLQVTFDPPPTFAAAIIGIDSNAPDLRRYQFTAIGRLREHE